MALDNRLLLDSDRNAYPDTDSRSRLVWRRFRRLGGRGIENSLLLSQDYTPNLPAPSMALGIDFDSVWKGTPVSAPWAAG